MKENRRKFDIFCHTLKDIPLISLANVLHRAGLYNDSLIVANMALEISPKFVVVHFTIANIYASMGDYDMAATFYLSTVTLQSTFDPARDRLMSLYCSKKSTIQLNVGGGQTSKEELWSDFKCDINVGL